ncbi:MAG: hypothetical protein ACO1O1_14225 [Adhaeribacter sp.]
MKPTLPRLCLVCLLLLLVLVPGGARLLAQQVLSPQTQDLRAFNLALQTDQQKQAELTSLYEQYQHSPLHRDDTLALYLADLDAVIAVSQKQHINYPVRLMADCRDSLRQDLRELTMNGVQAGYSFKKIAATNDAYLKEMFEAYKNNYRTGWGYRKAVPEFGRADYLKAIKTIFTTIVTLKVNAMPEEVKVVVYSMQDCKFVASGMGKTEFIQPLESGAYIVELSKPGYQRKLKKVVLGKYPKIITINEPLAMQ